MDINVGYYMTRSGSIVYVLKADIPNDRYPIVGYEVRSGQVHTWARGGSYNSDQSESILDLSQELKSSDKCFYVP